MEPQPNLPGRLQSVLSSHPDVVGGALCFAGTRVPVTVLLDNLAEGIGIDEFLEEYPSVGRDQVSAVLEFQAEALRAAVGLPRAG